MAVFFIRNYLQFLVAQDLVLFEAAFDLLRAELVAAFF